MITVLVGKKTDAFDTTLKRVVLSMGKGSEIERVEISRTNAQDIIDQIQTGSPFGEKKVFIITGLFEYEDVKNNFLEQGSFLASAPNDVVVVLESILVADTKKFETFAEVQKVLEKIPKASSFDTFALANAFATGDRKKTWIVFQEVLAHSDEMESIHGMIWWKLKDMMQKRSVYDMATMQSLAKKLVAVYHESRSGGLGMAERLEEFFLTMPPVKK